MLLMPCPLNVCEISDFCCLIPVIFTSAPLSLPPTQIFLFIWAHNICSPHDCAIEPCKTATRIPGSCPIYIYQNLTADHNLAFRCPPLHYRIVSTSQFSAKPSPSEEL